MSEPASLGLVLLEAMEMMSPILDAADGLRADLEKRGWSPTAAETAAGTWLIGAITASWRAAP